MKTQPLQCFLRPPWVATTILALHTLTTVLLAGLLIRILFQGGEKLPVIALFLLTAIGPLRFLASYFRAKARLRDPVFLADIRMFQGLKSAQWMGLKDRLRAEPEVEILREGRTLLANPFTWTGLSSFVFLKKGDLMAELYEGAGRVRSVRLKLIINGA